MNAFVRLNIIVEGQTEETFVRDLLQLPFAQRGLSIMARCVETGRKRGHIYRGGMVTYGKAKRDIQRWLAEDRAAYLTTMFDLYKLPNDFPGIIQAQRFQDSYQKVSYLEQSLAADIADRRFIPYIQLHEFEGLLFSHVQALDEVLKSHHGHSLLTQLQQIRDLFASPEEINDGETTAPSKRLQSLCPGYQKVLFGPLAAQRIGLARLRQECRHFHAWLATLEALIEIPGSSNTDQGA